MWFLRASNFPLTYVISKKYLNPLRFPYHSVMTIRSEFCVIKDLNVFEQETRVNVCNDGIVRGIWLYGRRRGRRSWAQHAPAPITPASRTWQMSQPKPFSWYLRQVRNSSSRLKLNCLRQLHFNVRNLMFSFISRDREREKEKPRQIFPEILDIPHDARDCGILSWRPLFIQRFSSIKVSLIIHPHHSSFDSITKFTNINTLFRYLYFSFRSWWRYNRR